MALNNLAHTYTTSGASLSYVNGTTNWTNTNISPAMTVSVNGDKVIIEEKAALEVKGKMVINGLDLEERLKTIERVLMIPERDATMEAKYPSLKKKFDDYINSLEKYRTFERLKGDENTTTP